MCVQWGRYNSDFVLGTRPYVAAAMIGATYVSYNVSVYAAIASPSNVTLMPMKAMVMTGSNFTDFQVCSCHLSHTTFLLQASCEMKRLVAADEHPPGTLLPFRVCHLHHLCYTTRGEL